MMAPAASSPVARSSPSKPGLEFTSRSVGPSRVSRRSTPATSTPPTPAARAPALPPPDRCRPERRPDVGGLELDRAPVSTAVEVAAELAPLGAPAHRPDHPPAHHQRAEVTSSRLGDELLEDDLLAEALEG